MSIWRLRPWIKNKNIMRLLWTTRFRIKIKFYFDATSVTLSLISNLFSCVGLATAAVNKEQKYSEIAVVYSVQDQNEDLF